MDSSEIDLSKENIQPLKEGRLTSYLGTALNAQCNVKSQNELLKEREKFELQLRKYKGDDPLEVWYDYISWVIQAYPNNDLGLVTTLIRKCVEKFKDDERYQQDVRYVKLWIRYIEVQNDPLEMYDVVHKHGIGSKCAEFYKAWAEEYEKAGDFKQASSIYTKGFEYAAQPASELRLYQRNFEDRVVRHLATKSGDDWVDSSTGSEQRQILSALAVTNQGRGSKHGTVGSLRTGSAIIGTAGVIKPVGSSQQKQKPMQFQIFSDHSAADSRSCVQMENVPAASMYNRENAMKPGKWTNGSSKRTTSCTSTLSSIPFRVHEDPSSVKETATPGGTSYSENVFKVRKVEKNEIDCPLAIFEAPDPTKVPMYCKDKVYSGGMEFSLEEIRAIKYLEAEENRKKELAKQNSVRILDENSKVMGNSEINKSLDLNSHNFISNMKDNFVTPKAVKLYENRDEVFIRERQKGVGSYNPNPSPMQNLDFLSAPSPTIHTKAANAMVNELFSTTFTQCLGDSLLVMPQQPQPSKTKFEIPCDDSTFPDIPDPEEKIASRPSKAPPFTIHCGENVLFQETPLNEESSGKFPNSQEVPKDWGAHIPFVPPPESEKDVGEYADDSSKENYCPPDYQPPVKEQRHLAGILVPSENIPFKPLEEGDDDGEEEEMAQQQQEGRESKGTSAAHHPLTDVVKNHQLMDGHVVEPPPFSQKPKENSFLLEMLSSLNDDSKIEFPVKRKFDPIENNEATTSCTNTQKTTVSLFSQNTNGGILFKQTCTKRTIETEIAAYPKQGQCWISQQLSKASGVEPIACDIGIKPTMDARTVWDENHSPLVSDDVCAASVVEGIEIVDNPTEQSMLETLLGKVDVPVCRARNFYRITQSIPYLKTNYVLNLRPDMKLTIQRVIGSSAHAKFFLAMRSDGEPIVIKYQRISCEWEFYIVREIRIRLRDAQMFPAFSNILEGYLFNADGSMLLTKYLPNGTFLDLLNMYKKRCIVFPEVLVLYFTIDIVNTVRHLHDCNIIHGAIRPENLLVSDVPSPSPSTWNEEHFKGLLPVLQLINMGKSIDMMLFPRNACFSSTSSCDQHQCIEMQNGRPWTYQIDLYGIAFTMHCMIFGEFMDISVVSGIWNINRKVHSYFNSGIWNNLFHSLLNVPSCDSIPNLQSIQGKLLEFMLTFEVDEFMSAISGMKSILEEENKKESNKIRAFKYGHI